MITEEELDVVAGMEAFIAPRSIAVVGASPRPGNLSLTALTELKRAGFAGPIVAVNPRYEEVDGTRCYPSLAEVPGGVDLVLVFVAARTVPAVVDDASAAGARAMVLFSSGFAEVDDEGGALQEEVVRRARAAGIRVLGPNCQGLVHYGTSLVATFTPAVAGDDLPAPSRIGYVGQSGAIGGSFFDLLRGRGTIPGAWFSTGNQADVTAVEVATLLVERATVDLVCLYLEQVPEGGPWDALTAVALDRGARLAVLRSGRSEAGRRAAASHTGALVRPDRAFELLSEQRGVLVASDTSALVDLASGFRAGIGAGGRSIGVVTSSGGAGALAADALSARGLELATFAPTTDAGLRALVPAFGAVGNPVDVTAQVMTDNPSDFVEVCRLLDADPAVEQILVVLTMFTGPRSERLADALAALRAEILTPISVVYLATHERTAGARAAFGAGGIAVFETVEQAAAVIDLLTSPLPAPRSAVAPAAPVEVPPGELLTEWGAAPLLDAIGVRRPVGRLVASADEAAQAAAELGDGPFVLKVEAPGLLHKTEVGGVRVGVATSDVAATYRQLLESVGRARPDLALEGVLVQQQAAPGVELLVGCTGPEGGYPPVLTVGIGGTAVELYGDVASAIAPVSPEDARMLLQRLRGWPLLAGHRGRPGCDVEAAVQAIVALSAVGLAVGDELEDLEVNPLIVHREGEGATAVDFVLRRKGA